MPYITQADLATLIPADFIIQALDDDSDRAADAGAWDAVEAEAAQAVDAYLEQRYTLPLATPVPSLVIQSAKIFACEILMQRRGLIGDKNPFTARANRLRTQLDEIASGERELTPSSGTAQAPSIATITEPAGTVPASGNTLNG